MLILSKQHASLLTSLIADKPVDIHRLVAELYGGRLDGGPGDAEGCIRVQIYKLRQSLRPLGIHILTLGSGGRSSRGYMVDPDHQAQAADLLREMSVAMLKQARDRQKEYAVNVGATVG